MDNQNSRSQENSVLSIALKGIALIVGLFILGNVIGSLSNIKKVGNFETKNNISTTVSTTAPSTTEPTQTTETTTELTTTKPTTTKEATTKDVTPDTKEEIVKLFNESANRIKTKSKKVFIISDDLF